MKDLQRLLGAAACAFLLFVLAGLLTSTPPGVMIRRAQDAPASVERFLRAAGDKATASRCALGTCSDDDATRLALSRLAVAPEAARPGYSRALFGPAWQDSDHNGCDQRDDVLRRDLGDVALKSGSKCVVTSGVGTDPYTGQPFAFAKAQALHVQVDHVVSLAEVWRLTGTTWSHAQRLAYATDTGVLVAATAEANKAKSDHDAGVPWPLCDAHGAAHCAHWRDARPGGRAGCDYARRVVTIKARYGLPVDPRERDALAHLLEAC